MYVYIQYADLSVYSNILCCEQIQLFRMSAKHGIPVGRKRSKRLPCKHDIRTWIAEEIAGCRRVPIQSVYKCSHSRETFSTLRFLPPCWQLQSLLQFIPSDTIRQLAHVLDRASRSLAVAISGVNRTGDHLRRQRYLV